MSAINTFLAGILSGINVVVSNYGWSIVVFTIFIKLVLFPLDFKSRKSMRRMSNLQPQITKLQKKYANDKEKLNQKTAELYRKEHINPLSGCLPMLVSFPVLIAMWGAMRMVANTELARQAIDLITIGTQQTQSWLWVKNLWMPDSPFATVIVNQNSLAQITANTNIWQTVFQSLSPDQVAALANLQITADTINSDTIFAALQNTAAYANEMAAWSTMPEVNLLFVKLTIYANNNGLFILPILAAVTQYMMTITQPQTPTAGEGAGAGAGTNKFMKWFFPIFSLYICSSYNAGFSIYWVMANIISWGQGIVLNKVFDAQDRQKASVEVVGEESMR